MQPGTVGINPGPMMAAADRITIEITGKGGHGAHAYLTVDPVLVAAHIITAVQSIVSRSVKAIDNAVVSLCSMQAGNPAAMSVVPGSATLIGTVRTFKPEVQDLVERRLRSLCSGIADAFGATAVLTYEKVYPATINSPAGYSMALAVAEALVGTQNVVRDLEPSMGSEDFSFMLKVKPGAYLRLGQGEQIADGKGGFTPGVGTQSLHNSRYDFNDAVLPLGAALFAGIVERSMPLG
jgi:hippurate hydrolase